MKTKNIRGIAILTGITVLAIALFIGSQISSTPLIKPDGSDTSNKIDYPSNVAGSLEYSLVIDGSLPTTVEKILVYKAVSPGYTREDIISLGQKFNMNETDRIKESTEGFGIMKEDHSMHAYLLNSGWAEFTNSNRAHNVNPLDVPENLPSDEEAVRLATSFLKEHNLFPDGAEFKRITHGRMYQLVSNGEDIVTWEDINVWFGRTLNGYPVEGTKLMVSIGGGGDVLEYFSNWRNYEPYRELSVKTPEKAFGELKAKGGTIGITTQGTATINEIYLAYQTKAGAETEYYLEPVWVFKGNVLVDGKAVSPIREYIPALTEVPPELLSS